MPKGRAEGFTKGGGSNVKKPSIKRNVRGDSFDWFETGRNPSFKVFTKFRNLRTSETFENSDTEFKKCFNGFDMGKIEAHMFSKN